MRKTVEAASRGMKVSSRGAVKGRSVGPVGSIPCSFPFKLEVSWFLASQMTRSLGLDCPAFSQFTGHTKNNSVLHSYISGNLIVSNFLKC